MRHLLCDSVRSAALLGASLIALAPAAAQTTPSSTAAPAPGDPTATGGGPKAPQPAPDSSTPPDTAADQGGIADIVVTAQRRSENLQNVPISIRAFTGDDLAHRGVKQSTDLAELTPNLQISLPNGQGNQPVITLRGIGLNDFNSNNAGPNGVYLDEVYISSPAAQSFQVFDLTRVEVLKGPQGTLYGRNSSGGAINFVSNKPTDTFEARGHLEYGSYNTYNAEAAVGGPIARNLSARIAFVRNYSEGFFRNTQTGRRENEIDNFSVRGTLRYAPTDNLSLLASVHYGRTDNRVFQYRHIGAFVPGSQNTEAPQVCADAQIRAGACVDLFGYGTPRGFYDGAYNDTGNLKVNAPGGYLRADWKLGAVTLTSVSAFDHVDRLHPEETDASPNRLLNVDFNVKTDTVTQELRAAVGLNRFNAVAGLYYLHENLRQNQPVSIFLDFDRFGAFGIPPGPGAGDGIAFISPSQSRQLTDAYAVFGQADYALTDQLKLTFGGRYTREDRSFHYREQILFQAGGLGNYDAPISLADERRTQDSSAFNFRAALDYKPTQDVLLYASAASGYKSGDFNGGPLSSIPEQIQLQLVPARPEHVTTYEVGIKSSWFDRHLVFNAAGFYNDYKDLQVYVLIGQPAPLLSLSVLDNADKAHTYGFEADLTARPTGRLELSASVGVLRTKLDRITVTGFEVLADPTGNRLPQSPELSLSGSADYKVPLGRSSLMFHGDASYKSKIFFDSLNTSFLTQDGYWIGNLRVGYQWHADRFEVAAFVRNVGDKRYYSDLIDLSASFGFVQGIVAPPRTIGGEFTVRF